MSLERSRSNLLSLSALALLVVLLRRERVSGDALAGALAVHLALGVLFRLVYTTIATIDATSPLIRAGMRSAASGSRPAGAFQAP
jgi:hypothetical protein